MIEKIILVSLSNLFIYNTLVKWNVDLWYDRIKKPKFFPQSFCLWCMCFWTSLLQSSIFYSNIIDSIYITICSTTLTYYFNEYIRN